MQVTCSQCAAEVPVRQDEKFLFCPYCDSSLFLDRSRVVFNYRLKPTHDEASARSSLLRWMAGNDTVRDLDRKATVEEGRFIYYPFWYLRRRADEEETIEVKLAHPSTVAELSQMSIPAGDLLALQAEDFNEEEYLSPTVHLETAVAGVPQEELREVSLVFVPTFRFTYSFESRSYSALVDGSSGKVFVGEYPRKNEAPFLGVGCLSCTVFLVLGVLFDAHFGLKLMAYFVASPILMALAYGVARKY